MLGRYSLTSCGFVLCLCPLSGQLASTSSASIDPKALLLQAAAVNGAPGAEAKPWHASISFTINDRNGKAESQGTFEEFWAAPDKFKIIYATPSFNQVEYTTPAGIRRTGNRDSAPPEITHIVDQFLHPIPLDAYSINSANFKAADVSLAGTTLSCVAVNRDAASAAEVPLNLAMRSLWTKLIPPTTSTFCLGHSAPILRLIITDGGASRIIRNGFTTFTDHVLPQSVEEIFSTSPSSEGKQLYHAKLEIMEPLGSLEDAQFAPPPDAVAAPRVITLAERDTTRQRVHHSYPQYDYQIPGSSLGSHMAALVIIALRIQTNGSVSPLLVVSGPPALRKPSLEAVKKWTYKPFQQDGEPVEVITTATLVYSLRP